MVSTARIEIQNPTVAQELFLISATAIKHVSDAKIGIVGETVAQEGCAVLLRTHWPETYLTSPTALAAATVVGRAVESVLAGGKPGSAKLRGVVERFVAQLRPVPGLKLTRDMREEQIGELVGYLSKPLKAAGGELLFFEGDMLPVGKLRIDPQFFLDTGWLKETTQPAVVEQAESGLEPWQDEFLDRYPTLKPAAFAKRAMSTAKNVHATASRWETEGKVFGLHLGHGTVYPQFQLRHQKARPVVAQIIELFKTRFKNNYDGWDIAFFMGNPSGYLSGERPVDVLDAEGADQRILSAARGHLKTAYDL